MYLYFHQILPQSSYDYFGYRTCELYLVGCNFSCAYCNTSDILKSDEAYAIDMRVIKKELMSLSKIAEAMLITGGEPTLQREALFQLLSYGRRLKLKVGVHTNGSKPDVIKQMLQKNLADFVVLDIKTPFQPAQFQKVTQSATYFVKEREIMAQISETIKLLTETRIPVLVVSVLTPTLMYKLEHMEEIAGTVKRMGCTLELRGFRTKGEIAHPKFKTLNEPTQEFLENMKELLQRKFPDLKITVG